MDAQALPSVPVVIADKIEMGSAMIEANVSDFTFVRELQVQVASHVESAKDMEEAWSRLKFPKERPPKKDFVLWEMALRQVVLAGGIQYRLGRVRNLDFKVWNWRWDLEGQRMLHLKGNNMDVYVASNLPRMEGVANRWTRARMDRKAE